MQYMGGKARQGKRIADVLLAARGDHTAYLEPFVGAGGVLRHVAPHFGMAVASDAHEDLILMWKALQSGWVPPETLSRGEYGALRNAKPSALRAFAGYGMSYGGKWFRGYASSYDYICDAPRDHCGEARRGLLKKINTTQHVIFRHCDYRDWRPNEKVLIYCDPPYAGTQSFLANGTSPFDTGEFWSYMQKWAALGATVFVTEYDVPVGVNAELICDFERHVSLNNHNWSVERLYRVRV